MEVPTPPALEPVVSHDPAVVVGWVVAEPISKHEPQAYFRHVAFVDEET